jgi:hypothetical protein
MVSHQNGQRYRAPRLGADGQPVAQPVRLALTPAQLDAYVGKYRLTAAVALTIARDGDHLTGHTDAQPAPAALFSERPDHFEFDLLDVDLDFERDAAGKVVAVKTRVGDSLTRAERLAEPGS